MSCLALGTSSSRLAALVNKARHQSFIHLTALAALLLVTTLTLLCSAQVNVLTQHNDIGRTGQNTTETLLSPVTVNANQFGKLFSLPVDGQIYAQPLYMSELQMPDGKSHNVVFVATEHDSVYAFDADSNGADNGRPLWQASLLSTSHGAASGATTVSSLVICDDIVPEYGITGTPVIDPVASLLYVVSFTQEGSAFVLRLHALSVTTGAEMLGGPVTIQAQVSGTGNGSSGSVLKFDPKWDNQRSGLLLLNGIVYIGFAAHGDNGDWHGWILSYNAATLSQVAAYNASPNGIGSGIWMGISADVVDPVGHPFGRMFMATGNGDYTAAVPYSTAMDYGETILNLDLTGGTPTVQDAFTPSNQATLTASDVDLGSGGVLILPDQLGPNPHLLAQEGKSGTLYLINRDGMGGYNATDNVVQKIASAKNLSGIWGVPAYWNGNLYIGEKANPVKAYSVANGVLSNKPTSVSPEVLGFPGTTPSISSSANSNGILWALETDDYASEGPAILRAYDATNLAKELYSSDQYPDRDSSGPADKFMVPTIANGKVYVGTSGELDVYGLFSSEPQIAVPVITPGSTTFTSPVQVTIMDATPGATIYFTVDGSTPTTSSMVYSSTLTISSTQTITAIAVAPGYVGFTPVSATYTSLNNTANPILSPPGGTFTTSPAVTITDANQGASIYYTTDGSIPTNASALYTGPIPVTSSETISAIAFGPGLSGSAVVSQTYLTESAVDFSRGFSNSASVMTFNGVADLDDSRLQLTNGYGSEASSAFVTAPLNVQGFITDFLFQLSNAQADGITFTIQGSSPTALGTDSSGLGYATIPQSLAIKFDFKNDAGEGADSVGVYVNGAMPTIPAIDLTKSGISLLSGDLMGVHLTYDGLNLAMTLADEVTAATWSAVWQGNIPQIVGGNTAYVGFTGSTYIQTSSQKIESWTYTAVAPGQTFGTATPVISPGLGNYSAGQMVSITDATAGAAIYYTNDGTAPTTTSRPYTAPFSASTSEKIQAIAVVAGGAVSGSTSTTLAIGSSDGTAVPKYTAANGFGYGSMILNGATLVADTLPSNGNVVTKALQLTDGGLNEAQSAYYANPVNVQQFTSDFDFHLLKAQAEGFTFVIQSMGLNAVGTNLGYGVGSTGSGSSIANSVAIGFDLNGTAGEGSDVALLFLNGNPSSTLPAAQLSSAGLQLNSGHVFHAHIVYDGTNLTLTLTDATTSATLTNSFPVNIPSVVGNTTAYVGFTGATSTTAATQNILDWTYAVTTPLPTSTAAPVISPAGGSYTAPAAVMITDAILGAVIYYTTDGSTPTTASPVYGGQITVTGSETIQAIALAPGSTVSGVASASFTIQTAVVSYTSGFSSQGLTLNGSAMLNGTQLQLTPNVTFKAGSAYFTSPVNVQSFTNDFTYQIPLPVSNGITFVIQNQGVTALGNDGGELGYGGSPGGIQKSVAVKFDVRNNSGEGSNSTGLYVNGADPTMPAMNLTQTGIVLANGHVFHVHMTYDGTTLVVTITDTVTAASATESYVVNIPSVVGSNSAYVGFTAGTGVSTGLQNILTWTYTVPPAAVATALPVISPAGGVLTAPAVVTIADATSGAIIYYTTDGSTPTTGSTVYSGQITINGSETIHSVALAPGSTLSGVASAAFTVQIPAVSYPSGFSSQQLTLNGSAKLKGTQLQLTPSSAFKAGSAYFTSPVSVQQFTNDFTFQLPVPVSDGMTFVIQNQGVTAVGNDGGELGYGGSSAGIQKSVAIKFDVYNDSGEGTDSTGLYTNGANPTVPATNLTSTGITLGSGHVFNVHMTYDGTTLTVVITDTVTAATTTESYAVNIPAIVGAPSAYVGFTAGSGASYGLQNVLTWTYASQ